MGARAGSHLTRRLIISTASQFPVEWHHVGRSKLAIVGVCTPRKWQMLPALLLSSSRELVIKHLSAHHWAQLMLIVESYGMLLIFQVFLQIPSHLIITILKVEIISRWECKVAMTSVIPFSANVHYNCLHFTIQVKRLWLMWLSRLSKVIQPIWGISGTWTKAGWNENFCALCHTPLSDQGKPQQGIELQSIELLPEE